MDVVIVGGYGVFGSRLAELLVRDGHNVVVAGRDLVKAKQLASRLGCSAQGVDLSSNPGSVFKTQPQLVVDASGPFQFYDTHSYRLPELCIENGADYLDLSDDARFTAGISILNEIAVENGRRLLSGTSSVPAISSSVVVALCAGFDDILLIDSAILPGNRAPRGDSVVASILTQLGGKSRIWRGGIWRDQSVWSDARRITLGPGLKRLAHCIEVPDVRLFPEFFKARSVVFRAGLELGVLNWSLSTIALVRRMWRFEVTPFRTQVFRRAADLFLPFGTDRGGMRVRVVGLLRGKPVQREWRLVAQAGDGPFIPAIASRAVINSLDQIVTGARPCLAEVSRAQLEAAMSDLEVSFEIEEQPVPTLFQVALASQWDDLPGEIKELHSVQDVESFSGVAEVARGESIAAQAIAWLFGFPAACESTPVTVTKTRLDDGELWLRRFGDRSFRSYCSRASAPHRVRERFQMFNFELDLEVDASSISLRLNRGWLFGIPLPERLLPTSDSREFVEDGVFRFDVALSAPLGIGLIVRYVGQLTPDRGDYKTAAV